MAAALADLQALLVSMGCSILVSHAISVEQGYDTLAELALLKADDVGVLCKVIRRPGGLVQNPALNVPGAVVANLPPFVNNPGLQVSTRAEKNLKLLAYYLRYQERVSRTVLAANITLAMVRATESYGKWEEDHENLEAPKIDSKDWSKTLEAIQGWLRGYLGQSKIPLARVIRADIEVPDEVADPATNYSSRIDELIARAPIGAVGAEDEDYLVDRGTVWDLIESITRNDPSWTYVKVAQTTRDGRMAYLALESHYLGPNNVNHQASKAEALLKSATYQGETRNWNFEKYASLHVEQFNILDSLRKHGYSGIDPGTRVRYLLAGIKTTKLESVTATILASPAVYQVDFDKCVTLITDFIKQSPNMMIGTGRGVQVAAVHADGTEIIPDMTVDDRYYKLQEFKNLTPEQKAGLMIKREKRGQKSSAGRGGGGRGGKGRGGGGRGGGRGSSSSGNAGHDLSNRSLKKLAVRIAALNAKEGDTDETGESEEEETPTNTKKTKASNRTNPALKRSKKSKD
jgi:uncharacterized membrane protein YgcG